jgi:ribosomal protein L40E
LLSACVVWIPVAAWAIATVYWVVEGEVDLGVGALSLYAAFAVGYFAVLPPEPWVGPLLMFVAWVFVLLYPFVRAAIARANHAAFDAERIEAAYETLKSRPDNLVGLLRLGRSLRDVGMTGHAIRILESALAGLPAAAIQEEQALLRSLRHESTPESFRPLPCLRCGAENAPGLLYCERCGAPFLLDQARRRSVLAGPLVRRLVAGSAAVVVLAVGIPGSAAVLPPVWAAVTIGIHLVVAAFVAYRAFSMPETAR